MGFLQAIVFGIVQGITGFLPISSSGHLLILSHIFKMDIEKGLFWAIMLHFGTLVPVFIVFWQDIRHLVVSLGGIISDIMKNTKTLIHNKKNFDALRYQKILKSNSRKFAVMMITSALTTAVVRQLLQPMARRSNDSLLATGIGLFITAVFLLVANYTRSGHKAPLDINLKVALIIGVGQGFAVLPGISRVGMTIALCLLCGLTRKFTIKYSFILSIPTIIGTGIMTLITTNKGIFSGVEILYWVVAIVIAVIVGLGCIKFMLALIQKQHLKYFAGYCLIVGVIAIVCYFQ